MSSLPHSNGKASHGHQHTMTNSAKSVTRHNSRNSHNSYNDISCKSSYDNYLSRDKLLINDNHSKEDTLTAISTISHEGDVPRHLVLAIFRIARRCRTESDEMPSDVQIKLLWESDHRVTGVSLEDFVILFTESWRMVKYRIGEGPLADSIKAASLRPIPPELAVLGDCYVTVIARLCQVLGEQSRGAFHLSSTALSEELGKSQPSISRALRYLVTKGILRLESRGKLGTASKYSVISNDTF